MNDYDIVEYPHRPISQAHPDRFAVVAALHGVQPAPLSRSRVLELGCGSGGNLIPLADLHPDATFFGVDLSDAAIAQGRRRIDALGLPNLRLERMDVMDFPDDAGEFDYIIAHGLFSWVPQPVREKVLDICRRHLAPQGIAYVSYNAYPGCHLRAMWRDMMLFHTAQFDDRQDRIDQARQLIELVAHGTGRGDAAHLLAQEEHERCTETTDSGIFHDDLAPVWQPFHVHEFVALADRHGMQFAGEAIYGDMLPTGLDSAAIRVLAALEDGDPIRYQQYLDFFKLRRFRRTLLCRAGIELQRAAAPAALARCHFSAQIAAADVAEGAPPGSRAFRNRLNDVTVTTADPASQAVLDALDRAWPASLSFAELAAIAGNAQRLAASLLTYYGSSFLNIHLEPHRQVRVAGARPTVWRVARLESGFGKLVPHLHHGIVEIEEEGARRLLQMMDGTRTRAELGALCGGEAVLEHILERLAQAAVLVS